LQLPSEDSEVHQDSNSQSGSSLGSVRVHSFTLSYIPKSMKCDSRVSPLARTFASPCFGRKPKVKVGTNVNFIDHEYARRFVKIGIEQQNILLLRNKMNNKHG